MAFDFPNTPTTNQIATMPDGTVRRWDGIKWVAGQSPTGPYCFVGDIPPSNPTPGVTWWDSVSCQLFVYYNDGNSSQWVPAVAVPASIGEAPSNGNFYARQNGLWTNIGASQIQGNAGRNLLHNPLFNVQQRGQGSWSVGYTADRWIIGSSIDVCSAQIVNFNDAGRAQVGDEAANSALLFTFTGTSNAAALSDFAQPIENVRRLAGKTVTVSFWASCSTGTLKCGVNIDQYFGSGGSPSANVNNAGQSVTLSTTLSRYIFTFTMPSIAGKILGTNGNDASWLQFWGSAGSNYAIRSGNIGVQSGAITIWGVQLEIGTVATQLEKLDPRIDLANCQRFYAFETFQVAGNYPIVNNAGCTAYPLPTKMRASPAVTFSGLSYSNCSGLNGQFTGSTFWVPGITVPVAGMFVVNGYYQATADL